MRTNIVLDDKLVEQAFSVSKSKTKKELINEALREFIANHNRKTLLDLKGKVSFREDYDYKKMRA
jgi:Arc/MetJ family transcription regulator